MTESGPFPKTRSSRSRAIGRIRRHLKINVTDVLPETEGLRDKGVEGLREQTFIPLFLCPIAISPGVPWVSSEFGYFQGRL